MSDWEQLSLLDPPARARGTDPETSWGAASTLNSALRRDIWRIQLQLLREKPDTHHGLWNRYEDGRLANGWVAVSDSGFRTRVSEMVDFGWVEDSKQRDVLPSGRKAVIWRVTEDAPVV